MGKRKNDLITTMGCYNLIGMGVRASGEERGAHGSEILGHYRLGSPSPGHELAPRACLAG